MSIAAGLTVTALTATVGFIISAEVAELWDDFVFSWMRYVEAKLEAAEPADG
jgi:hypothetical protein